MDEKVTAAVLASFAADSLSLGVHWIYNTNVIDKKYGRVETLLKPKLASFHRGKEKGEFTHYGDQALTLLDSVAGKSGFDLDDFSVRWRSLFDGYNGYVDGATKGTIENFGQGKSPMESGSGSSDLGGAARIAPLLLACRDGQKQLVTAAKLQTAMTHNHPAVIDSAGFFAHVADIVIKGTSPVAAIEEVKASYAAENPVREMVEEGLASIDRDTRQAISDFGQMCEIDAALPATLHLIGKYEDDLKNALVENVMAGGDSSARGMLAGMVLGAFHGIEAIPRAWISEMVAHDRIVSLLG